MPEFLASVGVLLTSLVIVVVAARRELEVRHWLRSLTRVVAALLPFSLIPGIAFYPALTTVTCFGLLSATIVGLLLIRSAARVSSACN